MVGNKDPHCGWCGRPVDEFGFTCDRKCYDAWQRTFGGPTGRSRDQYTATTRNYEPVPVEDQPWYVAPTSPPEENLVS